MAFRYLVAAAAALLFMGLAANHGNSEPLRPSATGPSRIAAEYDAKLAGIKLGDFKVIASFGRGGYDIVAKGDFSVLGGILYKGGGQVTSRGALADTKPVPARFTLNYADKKKSEKRDIRFKRGAVGKVSLVPKKRPHPQAVPITPDQTQSVLDPLTAAFLPVRSAAPPDSPKVCNQTLRVFEGKQRFDLVLSPKRTEPLDAGTAKGVSGDAAVCQARYKPIGGHKPDHPGVQYLQEREDMEVWLVPVPESDFYIPFKIAVPTAMGTGGVQLTGLEVKTKSPQAAAAP